MSDDEESSDDLPGLVGAVTAVAFMAHVGISLLFMMPGEERDPQPFMETFMNVGPVIWGILLAIVGGIALGIVVSVVVRYLLHDFGDDLRRWADR